MYDVTLLTDPRYLYPKENDSYTSNIIFEDRLVSDELESLGLKVNRVTWDDPFFDWSTTNYALFRAVWDYFDRFEEFTEWFQKTSKKTRFINSKNLIQWNIDKHYLLDLQERGVQIPNTLFLEKNSIESLNKAVQLYEKKYSNSEVNLVLKPCIAGGAWHTYKFHISEVQKHEDIFQKLIAREAMMLQEFQKNIVNVGEISMMCFGGKFSHAILKKAKKGDFRVQDDYGGSIEKYKPTEAEIAFAEHSFAVCDEMPLYGRADIFKDNEGHIAMAELEIFEPELWFRSCPKAAQSLAKQIKESCFD